MKKIAFAFCFLMSIYAYSQSDFRKGFIINNKGEKINGFINYKENASVYEYCEFKKTLDSETVKYSAKLINEYGFVNYKKYISKEIIIDNIESKKFLEIIVNGKATLLKYISTFYIEKENLFKKLDNKLIEFKENFKTYRRPSNRYIGVLKLLLSDCNNIKITIEKIKYNEIDLTKLISKYNNCSDSKNTIVKNEIPWIKVKYGVSAGFDHSTRKLNNPNQELKYNKNIKPNSSAIYGITLNFTFPRAYERFSLQSGLFYSSNKFYDYQESSEVNKNVLAETRMEIDQIKFPVGLKYTFPKMFVTPFLTIGLSNNFILNSNSLWTVDFIENNIIETYEYNLITNKYNIGGWASIGIIKRITKNVSITLEAKYDISKQKYTNAIIDSISFDENINSIQFLIGLEF